MKNRRGTTTTPLSVTKKRSRSRRIEADAFARRNVVVLVNDGPANMGAAAYAGALHHEAVL